mgnify:CR=1 FL=1
MKKKIRSILTAMSFLIFGLGATILNFGLFPFIKQNKMLRQKQEEKERS